MYYPNSIKIIREKIKAYSDQETALDPKQQETIAHIAWMLKQIESMDSDKNAKAGRWMGWVLANLEFMDIITNQESQDMIRTDVANHND